MRRQNDTIVKERWRNFVVFIRPPRSAGLLFVAHLTQLRLLYTGHLGANTHYVWTYQARASPRAYYHSKQEFIPQLDLIHIFFPYVFLIMICCSQAQLLGSVGCVCSQIDLSEFESH